MLRTITLVTVLSSSAFAGSLATPVVGGTEAPPGRWPDAVAVLGTRGACSGTLLAADLVLTAGHCSEIDPVEVIVDTVDYAAPGGQVRRVKWTRAYPDWANQYDVSIIMLENPVFAPPRAVAKSCELKTGEPLTIVGFGLTDAAGHGENSRLHEATIPVVDPTCTNDIACAPQIAPGGELIAGGHGTDSCFGDSGGPVYIDTKSGPALIGVVSRASGTLVEPCGGGGVYVRADKVVDWIERTSGRKLARAACDSQADDPGASEESGCNTGSGALEGGFVVVFVALVIAMLRRAQRKR